VFVSTGATEFDSQWREFPWTIGWQPDYIAEGRLYGLHAKANFAGKKIGVIYQNDDYGKDYLYGFRAALGKAYADEFIVDQEAIEPTATSAASQMTKIKASGAQVFAVFQLPTPTVRSIATGKALGFNPDAIYMNSVANVKPAIDAMVASAGAAYTNGIISITYYKDPQDPKWANDPAMKLYRSIIAKYSGGANADDPQVLYGVAKADTFVQALYKAGKNPTRAGLMSALTSLDTTSNLLLPGMRMKTSKTDHYVISQMQLQRLNSTTKLFVPFGQLIEARPR
jgi:branched-chain amino acid transport system substrate-binding protein